MESWRDSSTSDYSYTTRYVACARISAREKASARSNYFSTHVFLSYTIPRAIALISYLRNHTIHSTYLPAIRIN